MDSQATTVLTLLARHLLTTAGGVLVAHGYLQSSGMSDFIGGGMVLLGVAWSWWQKQGQAETAALLRNLTKAKDTQTAVAVAKELPAGSAISKGLP
jgi:hypothetical protein